MINHDIDLIHALKDRLGASLTQFENITKSLEKMKQDLSTIKWEFESVQTPSKKPSLKIDYRDSSGRSVLNQTLMLRDRSCTQPLFDKYGVDSTFDASTRRYQEIDNCDIDHYDAISVINARVKSSIDMMNELPYAARIKIFAELTNQYPHFFIVEHNRAFATRWLRKCLFNYPDNLSEMKHKLNGIKSNTDAITWLTSENLIYWT